MTEGEDDDDKTMTKTKTKTPLSDPALKWGVTPPNNSNNNENQKNKETAAAGAAADTTDWENYYDEATKAKLRAKGINPALKAEMEHGRKQSREGSFWGKVAATSFGGGWIK